MPVYKVDIEKVLNGEYWTNVYHVTAADLATAELHAAELTDIERGITLESVTFTRYRVSNETTGSTEFSTVPLGETGDVEATQEYLPLFNVVRVDFAVPGRRALRKYLRLPMAENQQHAGVIETATRSGWNSAYAAAIVALGWVIAPDGTVVSAGAVYPNVGMRQLRRGSRRTTPVLP